MKIQNRKIRILVRVLVLIFIIVPVLVIIFISPITKYLVEKYDVKYTGREIKMDWAYVNPFTGYVYFKNFKIYEAKNDTLFFSAKGVSANFSVHKLFSANYEISELTLDEPEGIVIQTGKNLNLDDIIKKFSPVPGKPRSKNPVHFSILSITINNGKIHYRETLTPINVSIIKLQLQGSGIRWDSDTIAATFSFLSGLGPGTMKGNFAINTKNLDYHLKTVIDKFDLNFINQYLKDLSNHGVFRASLDADLNATGNFKNSQDLSSQGKITLNEFHFGKDSADDYASFRKFTVGITQLSPKNHQYIFDTMSLIHPFFKYEQYDYLDNVQTMFGAKGSLVTAAQNSEKFNLVLEIGKYIKLISQNFFASYYRINRLAISEGDMQYNDFALNEKFGASANPLSVTADSIDKNHKRVEVTFKSGVMPYGEAVLSLSINPKDSSDFDLTYHFQKFPLSMFNPYLITYTSFPLDRGTLEFQGVWHVRNGFIQSTNHLIIVDPRVTKRIRKKDTDWIPLPLAMAFIRERGNVIDYEIPITGNMKSPDFHLKDVFMDLLRNIFIKPPTTPYRMEVKNTEAKIEKSLNIKWAMRQCNLDDHQERFMRETAEFLGENPNSSIVIHPVEYSEKEKEYILFFEAKKKYFLLTHAEKKSSFTERDSTEVDRMSNKDKGFMNYLTKFCNDSSLHTVQEQCYRFIGPGIVDEQYKLLLKKREQSFRSYFIANGTNKQVKFTASETSIPFNGFSFYKIKYNGELPEALTDAYEKMEKLNEEAPRIRYFRLRKKEDRISGQEKLKVK